MLDKPHKFFEGYPDIDNDALQKYLYNKFFNIKSMAIDKKLWDANEELEHGYKYDPGYFMHHYNVFQFDYPDLRKLLDSLRKMVIEACEYYEIDIEKQNYHIHSWFNYFDSSRYVGKSIEELPWHDHGDEKNQFHGYYAVKAEPSITHYKINGEYFANENINGRAIISESSRPHAFAEWNRDEHRITIAYDIFPLQQYIDSRVGTQWEVPLVKLFGDE